MAHARRDRGFWEGARADVERGAKVADVARRLGVRAGTLSWWLWKLRRQAPKPRRQRRTEFLPVVLAGPVRAAPAAIELEAGGVRLRVEVGTDVRYVAAMVAALRAAC